MSAAEQAELHTAGIIVPEHVWQPTTSPLMQSSSYSRSLSPPSFWPLSDAWHHSAMAWGEVAGSNVFWEITLSSYHHEVPTGFSLPIPLLSCTKPISWLTWYLLSLGHIRRYMAKGLTQQTAVHHLTYLHCQKKFQKKFETTERSCSSILYITTWKYENILTLKFVIVFSSG